MNNIVITIVLVLCSFLFVVFLTNTITISAQQQMPSSSNTPPQIPSQSPSSTASPKAVKIISPIKGQQIPVGKELTIAGTSIDNANSNCQVSMSVNRVRPYQPANAAGTGGANDYSKWNFVLRSNYTTIKPGPDNRITAKYTCTDNSVVASPTYSSVNVTGVMDATSTTTTTSTTIPTANVLQQKQQTMTTSNNATTISNGNPNKITPQDKPSLSVVNNNTTPVGNSVSTPPLPPHTASTPTKTPGSDGLLYLGINSKSANKVDDNTKSAVAHHSSSNDDNSFKPTTKIKTQHTSSTSDKSTKKTTTIANNIAEEHHSKNPSTSKTKTSHSSDKSINSDKSKKTTSNTAATTTAEEHHSKNPSTSKTKTSHSSDKSNDGGGGVIDSEFGHSDPLSDALDAMSNTLDHLFG
jgi:hypothetical protein